MNYISFFSKKKINTFFRSISTILVLFFFLHELQSYAFSNFDSTKNSFCKWYTYRASFFMHWDKLVFLRIFYDMTGRTFMRLFTFMNPINMFFQYWGFRKLLFANGTSNLYLMFGFISIYEGIDLLMNLRILLNLILQNHGNLF